MKINPKKSAIFLAAFLCLTLVCMLFAHLIQTDFGKVAVSLGTIETEKGDITYKLYTPETATAESKAPAVLLLHGYQNDHETCAAYAIELARRGVVVMAIDEFGHGATEIGMKERGYTNHKVTVTYGLDSEADKTYVEIGGAKRFRVMMNFSNLSFFNDRYSKGSDGSSVEDSSMGGIAAYAVLAGMDNVDPTRMGVSGHSMGTWASWTVSAAYAGATDAKGNDITPKATIIQCGELFTEDVYDTSKYYFNNVMLLQAKWDEFNYFRDYQNTVSDDLLKTPLRTGFLGTTADNAAWNTTFGSFADGSARRIELLYTNHRLTTHNENGMEASIDWFTESLKLNTSLKSNDLVFLTKEWLVFFATLSVIAAMMPLMNLLLGTRFFSSVHNSIPNRPERVKSGWKWGKGAIITVLISAATYPFMTQLGHGLLPLPEGIFRMTIGNGFLSWYLLLIIIMLITTLLPWKKAKKIGKPLDFADLGFASEKAPRRFDWGLCGKSALLALCMTGMMYLYVFICEKLFLLDFRFIWPFFKSFTGERFVQFLIYIPIFAIFFALNNSKIFAQMRVEGADKPGLRGYFSCWWKYAVCMIGGVVLLMLVEYIPFFANIGPGADLLFGTTFGGPFMSLMIVFVPQVIVFSFICTYAYRKTGSVYTGAFTVATLACWIVTGGSAIF